MAARLRESRTKFVTRALRLSGDEVFSGAVADHGEDIVITDGVREERISKTMARRYITTAGEVLYLVNLDFPAVTKAEELATLEERICFDALNGSTQPPSDRAYSMYISIACLVLTLLVVFWVNQAAAAASKAVALGLANQQAITTVLASLEKVR